MRDVASAAVFAAAICLVAGGCGSSSSGSRAVAAATATAAPESAAARASRSRPVAATATPAPSTARSVALVWGVERPSLAARRLRRHPAVESATVTGRGVALLRGTTGANGRAVERVRAGYAVPLDVLSVDPRGYSLTLAQEERAALARLQPGRAVLSRTAARLRRVGQGGVLRLVGGRQLRVAAVVDDALVRDAELAVAADDPRVRPSDRPSVLAVLRPDASVSATEIADRAGRGAAARVLEGGPLPSTGPVGPVRPGELKVRFGEPAVGLPYGDDWVRLDPAFVDRYIVRRRVPILGAVTCHRAMFPALRAALSELRRRGLARLVDPGDYAGCYAPRRIRPGGALSLHAWGLAVDLNASANPFGGRSHQDRRLVDVMRGRGFTWGGDWPTIRDPMHFEFRGR